MLYQVRYTKVFVDGALDGQSVPCTLNNSCWGRAKRMEEDAKTKRIITGIPASDKFYLKDVRIIAMNVIAAMEQV